MVENELLKSAAAVLERGGVVACATEGVLGLSCRPDCHAAIERILAIKQRPADKGMILVAADYEQLVPFIDESRLAPERKAEVLASWPAAVTWLLPARPEVSILLRGVFPTLAVRVTPHPQLAALCRLVSSPLVSTSANLSGEAAPASFAELDARVAALVDYCLPGETLGRRGPSQIRSLDGVTIRGG